MDADAECHQIVEAINLVAVEIRQDIITELLQNAPEDRCSLILSLSCQLVHSAGHITR